MPEAVRIRVLRGDPGAGKASFWQEYEIDLAPGESVTGVLRRINEDRDGSLAYRVSCHRGICASCIMRINGKQRLGCVTEVTGDLELQPAFGTVLKDLVVEQ
jgi:succinate dehydrogenase / fumarate reductase, iron-sulfur subunit